MALIDGLAETAKGQGTEHQAEIAQRDIEVTWDGKEVEDNQQQPGGHHVGKYARLHRDSDTGDDFDYPDGEHEFMSMAADEAIGNFGQILVPVHQQMEEFVEAGDNGRDGKPETQDKVGLADERVR